jgi:hypothetical protein
MNFPRHGAATDIRRLRQQLVQIFRDYFLRLRTYAALRLFFFTLAFFLVALDEALFLVVLPDLVNLVSVSWSAAFRFSDFPTSRSLGT